MMPSFVGGSLFKARLERRAGPADEDPSVVFWVDILLLCVLGLFTLFALPGVLNRLKYGIDRKQGYFLFNSSLPSHAQFTSSRNSLVDPDGYQEKHKPTGAIPRFPTVFSILPYVTSMLRKPAVGSVSFGGALLLSLYFGLLLFAGLYQTNIWTNPIRTGYVAISQIPVVFIFATKNNIVGMLLGTAYDKLNYIHRFAGVLLVIAGNIHAIGTIYQYTLQGVFQENIADPGQAWGLVALVCVDVLCFFSLDIWRRKAHNIFFTSHFVAFILFLVAVCAHVSDAIPYAVAGACIYGVDRLFRLFKSRICTARIRCVPELQMTHVHIPKLNSGWRAGQHVRVRVLSLGMGPFGWAETHPYTIASASDGTVQDGMVLMCKKTGGWTRKLYQIAGRNSLGVDAGSNVRVIVEGPYGGPENAIPASFTGAIFVVGGSGITYGLSGVQDLVQMAAQGKSNVGVVDLVWSVHHPDCLAPLLPIFSALLLQSASTNTTVRISVFYTRAITAEHTLKDIVLPAGITLSPGRPHISTRLIDFANCAATTFIPECASGRKGVFVGVCGPAGLGESVQKAIEDMRNASVQQDIRVVMLEMLRMISFTSKI